MKKIISCLLISCLLILTILIGGILGTNNVYAESAKDNIETNFKYNCHSYAWYSTSTSNSWWMNDPSKYMSDRSYNKLSSPTAGLKFFYPLPNNEHSGIISSVNGEKVTVVSKWGAYGVYTHLEDDCPYASVYLNTYWIINLGL